MKTTEYFKKGTQPTENSPRYEKLDDVTNLKSVKVLDGYELTWNWKVPNVLDNTYLTKYFSNSVYGNSSSTYLANRISYNENTLGSNGFGIYKKNSNGNLERIAFTKETKYTYKPTTSGTITLVVKAEYGNFKDNASNGIETKITIENIENQDTSTGLTISLIGNKSITIDKSKKEKYSDNGITIKYEGKDVTKDSEITYLINNKVFNTKIDLENAINNLADGTYQLKYKAIYKGPDMQKETTTTSLARTIIIKENNNENNEETQ